MNMHIKNNITQTATNLWNFVNDFEVGNIAELQLDVDEANAIHSIIEASKAIVNNSINIYKFLNNTD